MSGRRLPGVALVVSAFFFLCVPVRAATVTVVTDANMSGATSGNPVVGVVDGTTGLGGYAGAGDTTPTYLEFTVSPSSAGTNTTVDVNTGSGYPYVQFEVTQSSPSGPAVIPLQYANNTAVAPISGFFSGVDYFLQLFAPAPATFGIAVTTVQLSGASPIGGLITPLPGTLILFGSVIAGAGLLMRRRRNGANALGV